MCFLKGTLLLIIKNVKIQILPQKLKLRSSSILLLMELVCSVFKCFNYYRKLHNLLLFMQILLLLTENSQILFFSI